MPSKPAQIHLHPVAKTVAAAPGTPLADVLFPEGVEFPCGGRGRCRGCRVRVLAGTMEPGEAEQRLLSEKEIADGWRLACRHQVEGNVSLAIAQWESPILADNSTYAFERVEGLGVAVDIGTTTVVAQLVDLRNGSVLAVRAELNRQARHGSDLMSRIGASVTDAGGSALTGAIRRQVARMIGELMRAVVERDLPPVRGVVLVGNTAMHHLFGGLDAEPLSRYPFEPERSDALRWTASELRWTGLPEACPVTFLPCIGGFVGSDVLAGLLAVGFDHRTSPAAFLDLGTNGEIVAGNGDRILCASTAAGPAFEGARISMGMRAATGAITAVHQLNGKWECRVLGGGEARGICGSGLVSAVATGLDLGTILASGRLARGDTWMIQEPVSLHQCDVRELQLAKGAVAAGIELLLSALEIPCSEIETAFLAGAFGNYVSLESALRIGLFPFAGERVTPAGNTALLGAKIALHAPDPVALCNAFRKRITHVSLHADPDFQEAYVSAMRFPDPARVGA